MEFLEYLESKKINAATFEKADPELFSDFQSDFEQMHPNSFTAQKLFLINNIRRKYPIKLDDEGAKVVKKAASPRPKLKPKPKL